MALTRAVRPLPPVSTAPVSKSAKGSQRNRFGDVQLRFTNRLAEPFLR
jgi:hypothetical protein